MPIKKVFLSSTARDLQEYREAAYRAIEGLDGYHCVRMEDFGARNWDADEFCRAQVVECDLFVGILGHLYGSCPEGSDQSYTEREYEAAVDAGKPRLMFVAPRDFPVPSDLIESDDKREKQTVFRERVNKDRILTNFNSPDNLAMRVSNAIRNEEYKSPEIGKLVSCAPFQAPTLPEYFIPRPEKSKEVKLRLLTRSSDRPGVLVVSALHGLGGIGKTVLASSLAHDEEVINRFSDGVLWATLGKEPDLLSLLSGWIQALGDYEFRPTTPEAASMHLSTLLHDKTMLLVVDDAWKSAHVQPFRVGGINCQLLITTRDSLIAEAVDARLCNLDVMTEDQSLALLSKRLGRELDEAELKKALDLAKEVGYLPLALNLIAAQVEDGVSWAELLEELRAEIARLEALEKPGVEELDEATRKNFSLRASFQLSLQSLPEKKRVAFAWLGVLPDDVLLAPTMVTTLWDVDFKGARETLRYLRNKALLQQGPKVGDVQTYRLHDMLHEFAKNLILDPETPATVKDFPGLGLTIKEAHSSLLERYKVKTVDGLWHTLADDAYIHDHLIWHMEKAGRTEEIHVLFQEETVEGKNGWYQTRERLGQMAGFLDDIDFVRQLVNKDSSNIGLQVRYALINASLYSLSTKIPPDLIVTFIKKNKWTVLQGLDYALKMPYSKQRAEVLSFLAPYIPNNLMKKTFTIVRSILENPERAKALTAIAPRLLEMELIQEYLSLSMYLKDETYREKTLSAIAPQLQGIELIQEYLSLAMDLKNETNREKALSAIAPNLPEMELVQEYLLLTKELKNEANREKALSAIAPHLLEMELIQEYLSLAKDFQNETDRMEVMLRLFSNQNLDVYIKRNIINDVLEIAMNIQNYRTRIDALLKVIPNISNEEKRNIVDIILELIENLKFDVPERRSDLQILRLDEQSSLLGSIMEEKGKINEDEYTFRLYHDNFCAEALINIAPYMQKNQIHKAINFAQNIHNEVPRVKAISSLISKLNKREKQAVLESILPMAINIKDDLNRIDAITNLAYNLKNDRDIIYIALKSIKNIQIGNIYNLKRLSLLILNADDDILIRKSISSISDIIKNTKSERLRAEILSAFFPVFREHDQQKYLDFVMEFNAEKHKVRSLMEVIPHISDQYLIQQVLNYMKYIQNSAYRIQVASLISPALSETSLNEVIDIVKKIGDESNLKRFLFDLFPHILEQDVKKCILRTISRIPDEHLRSQMLYDLSSSIPGNLMQDALIAAVKIKNEDNRTKTLLGLVQSSEFPEELMEEALKAATELQREIHKSQALSALVQSSQFPECLVKDVLRVVTEMQSEIRRSQALSGLVQSSRFPEYLMEDALKAAAELQSEIHRSQALSGLVQSSQFPDYLMEDVLNIALNIKDESCMAKILSSLAPRLPHRLIQISFKSFIMIKDESCLASLIHKFVINPKFRDDMVEEILSLVNDMQVESNKAKLLSNLAPNLQGHLLENALNKARRIDDRRKRVILFSNFVPQLSEKQKNDLIREALKLIKETRNTSGPYYEYDELCVKFVCRIASHVSRDQILELLDLVYDIKNKHSALLCLGPDIPENMGKILFEIISQIEYELNQYEVIYSLARQFPKNALIAAMKIHNGNARSRILAKLSPYLLDDNMVQIALNSAIEIKNISDRTLAISALISNNNNNNNRDYFYPIWIELIWTLSLNTRENLVSSLSTLIPTIFALGGEEALLETARAIEDVGRWWP